jgi:MFS family permease
MLLPAIPEIMRDFDIPYGTAAWIFSGYLIVAAVMTPIAGRLSDIYGKKKVLLTLLAIYIAGTIAGGFANSILFLLICRVIQGVGLAAIPAAFSLLRDSFPPAKLAIAVGVFGSAYSAGSVVGLLSGASIIQHFGWNTTFFFIAPVAAIVTLLIAKFVKENKDAIQSVPKNILENTSGKTPASPSIDLKGAMSLSVTVIAFLIALTLVENGVSPENLPQIAACFAASAVSLSVFVVIERRVISPLLDLRLLKDKFLLPSYLVLMATGITMFLAYPSIVQLVRSPIPLGFGGDAVDAANVQLPFMIMFLVFASVTPLIISRIGNINPIIVGAIVALIGSIGLLAFHSTAFEVSANLAIIASGLSLAHITTWNVVITSSPKEFTGISVGVGALLVFIGMSIGPALAGVYMENHETIKGVEGSYPSLGSYNLVFITSGLLSAVCLVFALVLRKRLSRVT